MDVCSREAKVGMKRLKNNWICEWIANENNNAWIWTIKRKVARTRLIEKLYSERGRSEAKKRGWSVPCMPVIYGQRRWAAHLYLIKRWWTNKNVKNCTVWRAFACSGLTHFPFVSPRSEICLFELAAGIGVWALQREKIAPPPKGINISHCNLTLWCVQKLTLPFLQCMGITSLWGWRSTSWGIVNRPVLFRYESFLCFWRRDES